MFEINDYDYTIRIFNWKNDDQAISHSAPFVTNSLGQSKTAVSKFGPERVDLLLALIPIFLLVFHYGVLKFLVIVISILSPFVALVLAVNFVSKYCNSSMFNLLVGKSRKCFSITKDRLSSRVWLVSVLLVISFVLLGAFWR